MKNNKNLVLEANTNDVIIENNDGITKIQIQNNVKIGVEVDGDLMLKAGGDLILAADGEIDLITKGKPICIETIDSELHFNSRIAKPIKDLPESIEARQKMIEDNKRCIQIADMAETRNKLLKDRVTILEKLVEDISNKLINDFERKQNKE